MSKTSVTSLRDKPVLLEMFVSDKAETKRIKNSALPWFISSRVSSSERQQLSDVEQACLALEIDGMPCPMDISPESWVKSNFSYICSMYMERYPRPVASDYKPKPSKKERKAKRLLAQKSLRTPRNAPTKVAGIDVTTAAFLDTYEWRKVRMQALKLYSPRCMCCGATPASGAVMNVDHIKPRKLFPSLALDVKNLQILCHECNHGKGNWDQTDWRK